MSHRIILASGSAIRAALLTNAGVEFTVEVPRLDEDSIKRAMIEEGASARDLADTLAEQKARKIGLKFPGALVIGCDQVLDFEGACLSKPRDRNDAKEQLHLLSGRRHKLLSAAVIWQDDAPVWRHIGEVRLQVRELSEAYIERYLERNWDSVRDSVGCYKLEEEGVRLFSRIDGDYFNVLGLPLVELLGYLMIRGVLDG